MNKLYSIYWKSNSYIDTRYLTYSYRGSIGGPLSMSQILERFGMTCGTKEHMYFDMRQFFLNSVFEKNKKKTKQIYHMCYRTYSDIILFRYVTNFVKQIGPSQIYDFMVKICHQAKDFISKDKLFKSNSYNKFTLIGKRFCMQG